MSSPLQIVSVIAVMHHQDQFLLVQRSPHDDIFPGKLQNVGGKIEYGETVEQALAREIQEELNLQITQSSIFLQSYSWIKNINEPPRLGLIFLFNVTEKSSNIHLCDELINYSWYTYDQALLLETIGINSPTGTLGQLRAAIANLKTNKK